MNTTNQRPTTRMQYYAQRAFEHIQQRAETLKGDKRKEFASFTNRFPTLIHTCGLCQALAFAQAKDQENYLEDLAHVLDITNVEALLHDARTKQTPDYILLTRMTLQATSWLKRYAEALLEVDDNSKGGPDASLPK